MADLTSLVSWARDTFWPMPEPATAVQQPTGGVQAYTAHDINDPVLIEFLRDGLSSSSGVTVNDKVALKNSTFFRSCALIAGSIGMLPTHLMERGSIEGESKKARQHPLFRILHKRPNRYQTALEFKTAMQMQALLDGNAYAMVIRSGRRITQLVPLKRKSVTPELTDTFDLRFKYRRPSGGSVYLEADEVFHFRHPVTLDGLKGVSLLDMAADTIGIATIAQRAAGKLFKNGALVGGALETDKTLGDEAVRHLRQSMEDRYSGADQAGKWMILEEGLKAKTLSPNAKDAQHVETREHEAEEMARFTGVPRPLLMFDETSWGSGIEQLGLFFVTYCLMPWFVAWEQAVERILDESEEDRFYAKFNEGALLRGSLKDQAEFFAKALGAGGSAGWLAPNEAREMMDRNPKPDGDDLPKQAGKAAAGGE